MKNRKKLELSSYLVKKRKIYPDTSYLRMEKLIQTNKVFKKVNRKGNKLMIRV